MTPSKIEPRGIAIAMEALPIRRVVVVGIGAMACLFASRLHRQAQVTLVGSWPERRSRLANPGLIVEGIDGSETHHRLQASEPAAKPGKADLALILVKSPQTAAAADIASQWLENPTSSSPGGIALTLQNGLGNRDTLAAVLGKERTAQGVTLQAAHSSGPGRIRHAAEGRTSLGMSLQIERLRPIVELFQRSNLDVESVDSVDSLVWTKLLVNAAINPLTALLQCPNGALLEDPRALQLLSQAAQEVADVAKAMGIPLPSNSPAELARGVCRATASNRSSMLQDVTRGTTTEIDAICGSVVRLGHRWGIQTPINQLLLEEVEALSEGASETLSLQREGHAHRLLATLREAYLNDESKRIMDR